MPFKRRGKNKKGGISNKRSAEFPNGKNDRYKRSYDAWFCTLCSSQEGPGIVGFYTGVGKSKTNALIWTFSDQIKFILLNGENLSYRNRKILKDLAREPFFSLYIPAIPPSLTMKPSVATSSFSSPFPIHR